MIHLIKKQLVWSLSFVHSLKASVASLKCCLFAFQKGLQLSKITLYVMAQLYQRQTSQFLLISSHAVYTFNTLNSGHPLLIWKSGYSSVERMLRSQKQNIDSISMVKATRMPCFPITKHCYQATVKSPTLYTISVKKYIDFIPHPMDFFHISSL